jgi:hypothetical protein
MFSLRKLLQRPPKTAVAVPKRQPTTLEAVEAGILISAVLFSEDEGVDSFPSVRDFFTDVGLDWSTYRQKMFKTIKSDPEQFASLMSDEIPTAMADAMSPGLRQYALEHWFSTAKTITQLTLDPVRDLESWQANAIERILTRDLKIQENDAKRLVTALHFACDPKQSDDKRKEARYLCADMLKEFARFQYTRPPTPFETYRAGKVLTAVAAGGSDDEGILADLCRRLGTDWSELQPSLRDRTTDWSSQLHSAFSKTPYLEPFFDLGLSSLVLLMPNTNFDSAAVQRVVHPLRCIGCNDEEELKRLLNLLVTARLQPGGKQTEDGIKAYADFEKSVLARAQAFESL